MTAAGPDAEVPLPPTTSQAQAAALWTFVHLRTPRFTTDAALEVVETLGANADDDTKSLAKRLRKELLRHGVALKHVNAIEAAVRLQGHESWHARSAGGAAPALKAYGVLETEEKHASFGSWKEAAATLADWAEQAVHQTGVKVLELHFGESFVMLVAPWVQADKGRKIGQELPVFVVNSSADDAKDWLEGIEVALEMVRRRIEEPGMAILEGVSNLQLAPSPRDAANTELVLMQTSGEPDDGFEIARGTEVDCWTQFDLARADRQRGEVTAAGVAWHCGADRFVWQACAAQPSNADGVPPVMTHTQLNEPQVARLLHRYRLARRVLKDGVHNSAMVKMMPLFRAMASVFRVRPERIRAELAKTGLTWEDFIRDYEDPPELTGVLPIGVVLELVKQLKPADPNALLARPPREHLVRVHDDKMLRSMIPQMDHVRYRLTRDTDASAKEAVAEAIGDLAVSMRVRKMTELGLIQSSEPLPNLVYSGDAQELLGVLEEHGLSVWVGSMPLIASMPEDAPKDIAPYAVGNSLFLDIDFAGSEQ
jgi:hypothetical protein